MNYIEISFKAIPCVQLPGVFHTSSSSSGGKNIHNQELLALIPGMSLLVPGKYQDVPGSTSNFLV